MKIIPLTNQMKPLVTVVCLTYNQEAYIAETIKGFVSQHTNFHFEIIIHDDASTDSTLSVVMQYQERYPELITVISQEKNIYSKGVRVPALVFSHARGRFIAYCEGDDFWVDPHKLQKQADLLLDNPKIGVVFTNKNVYYQERGKLIEGFSMRSLSPVPTGDVRKVLLVSNPFSACTAMFRTEAVSGYEAIATKLRSKMDDYVMWLFIANKYDFGYLTEVTATYRVLKHSASHSPSLEIIKCFHKSTYKVASYFNREFMRLVSQKEIKESYRKRVFSYMLANGYYKASLSYASSISEYAVILLSTKIRRIFR